MASKNIYISDENVAVWEEAEKYAESMHLSVSQLVPVALRYFMGNVVAIGPQGLIEVGDVKDRQDRSLESG